MEHLGPEPAYGHGAAKEGKRVGILDLHANHCGQLKIVVFLFVTSFIMQGRQEKESVASQKVQVPLPAFCGRLQSSWDYFVSVFFRLGGRR